MRIDSPQVVGSLTLADGSTSSLSGSFSGSFEGHAVFNSIEATDALFVNAIFESSSTIVTSGSNVFGNDAADTQQITGSLLLSGSIVATAVGATINGAAIVTGSAQINHDSTTGFVSNEHIDHSGVSITAGSGLTGGGTIAATRTINIGQGTGISVAADAISTNDGQIVHDNLSGFVADEHVAHSGVTLTAGNGLTGGGTIAASRTFTVGAGTGITVNADDVQIANNGVGATQLNVTGNGTTSQFLRSDGDGSFTWATPAGYTVANSSNNRILTSVDSTNGNAEANLTFDGSTLTVAGTINETSARRFKENIVSLEDSLSKTLQLNPVEYDWIKDGKHDIGLIAEEVNEILPDLVHKEDGEIQGIHYSRLTAILIGAVKELTARLEELENK